MWRRRDTIVGNTFKATIEGQHQLDQGQKVPKVNDETGERR